MKFKMISFRRGEILDFGEADDAEEIKKFAAERKNADAFHAHPRDRRQSFFLTGTRMSRESIAWQKVSYTAKLRQFA